MCSSFAHVAVNFANVSHGDSPLNLLKIIDMTFIIVILCVFAWLGQALKDGADI